MRVRSGRGFTMVELMVLVGGGAFAVVTVSTRVSDPAPVVMATEPTPAPDAPKLESWQAGPAAWKLRIGANTTAQNVWPILNPDATEAWGAGPYARRVYGGRPGDGSPDQARRLRELSYVWGLARYGDFYVASLNPPDGERILWQIPASEWNPSGPNVLTCSDPSVPTLTAEK